VLTGKVKVHFVKYQTITES